VNGDAQVEQIRALRQKDPDIALLLARLDQAWRDRDIARAESHVLAKSWPMSQGAELVNRLTGR
jgi:hypothetical protein